MEAQQGAFEKPKLRKIEPKPKEEPKKDEKKEAPAKKKVVKKKPSDKDYELPEIPDYERPALEKYEKSDFTAAERAAKEQQITEGPKPEQGKAGVIEKPEEKLRNGVPKKEKEPEPAQDPRKLSIGKGTIPEQKDQKDDVKLKPVPEKQVLSCSLKHYNHVPETPLHMTPPSHCPFVCVCRTFFFICNCFVFPYIIQQRERLASMWSCFAL